MAWFFWGQVVPPGSYVAQQLFANSLLVMFCLSLFLAGIHISTRFRVGYAEHASSGVWLERLAIKERGRVTILNLSDVEWIESQGNYQALHTRQGAHLVRETSARLAARLDPSRFIRIHRRYVVAIDKVIEVSPLANGDSLVRLTSGTELRQSRQHRETLRACLSRHS